MLQAAITQFKFRFFTLVIVALSLGASSSLSSLELKRVILSTNNDPKYIDFWPIVAPIWTAMGFRPTLALIADDTCLIDESLGDVVRFVPIPGIPESLQAQAIRLLFPCLFPDDGCLLADIDMIPISRSYFVNEAAKCPDDGLLIYRGTDAYWQLRFPICYVAAKGSCFTSIYEVSQYDEIAPLIQEWAALGYGWDTDEFVLHDAALEWQIDGGRLIILKPSSTPRLDRLSWPADLSGINISDYLDCHLPRPYAQYRDSIDRVAQAIREHVSNS